MQQDLYRDATGCECSKWGDGFGVRMGQTFSELEVFKSKFHVIDARKADDTKMRSFKSGLAECYRMVTRRQSDVPKICSYALNAVAQLRQANQFVTLEEFRGCVSQHFPQEHRDTIAGADRILPDSFLPPVLRCCAMPSTLL